MSNILLLCLVSVSCNSVNKKLLIACEEKFLGFVLVYELACTELHGRDSFVKRIDPFSAINRHDCVLFGLHTL